MKNRVAEFLKRTAILRKSLSQILIVAVILATAYFSYNMGASSDGTGTTEAVHVHDEHEESGETIWTCSMHPQVRQKEPGDCPICGMELVPEKVEAAATKEEEKEKAKEPAGYACAMNCVPPLPNPGKCPVCGMEMVPVYDEAESAEGSAATLAMSEEAAALADIQTTEVKRQWVENQIALTGVIDYDETRMSTISAYIDGRLDRLYVDYTGIDVRKGDHMVKLFSRNLLTAMEELVLAKQAYERAQQSNVSDLQTYLNDIEGSRERLRLWGLTADQIADIEMSDRREDHITIYSPIAGTVVKKHVNEGEYVKTGSPIYTVADFSHVWLKLKAYETDLLWLHYGQDVEFTTESYPGEMFHGRISFIDPMLDQMSRTVSVRVNVENEDNRLKPGMFVHARVKAWVAGSGKVIAPDLTGKWISPMHPEVIKDGPGSCDVCGMPLVPVEELGFVTTNDVTAPLIIPASAPLITGKRAVVYVRVPGEDRPTFEGREITLGSRAGDYYLVKKGLAEGEKVVTNGAFKIDSALQIIAKPSMMNPESGMTMPGHEQSGHKH